MLRPRAEHGDERFEIGAKHYNATFPQVMLSGSEASLPAPECKPRCRGELRPQGQQRFFAPPACGRLRS